MQCPTRGIRWHDAEFLIFLDFKHIMYRLCNKYWQTIMMAHATVINSDGMDTNQALIILKTGHILLSVFADQN